MLFNIIGGFHAQTSRRGSGMRQAGNLCHLATCSHGGRVPPLGRSPGGAEVWLRWVGCWTGGVGYSLPSFLSVSFVRCPTQRFVPGLHYRNRTFWLNPQTKVSEGVLRLSVCLLLPWPPSCFILSCCCAAGSATPSSDSRSAPDHCL